MFSKTHLLVDMEGYIVGALCSPPKDSGWQEVQRGAFKALDKASAYFSKRPKNANRWGTFPSIACRVLYRGGQQVQAGPTVQDPVKLPYRSLVTCPIQKKLLES